MSTSLNPTRKNHINVSHMRRVCNLLWTFLIIIDVIMENMLMNVMDVESLQKEIFNFIRREKSYKKNRLNATTVESL